MTDQATPDISALLKALTPWDKVKGSGTPQFCADVADQWDRLAQQARSEDDRTKCQKLAAQWRRNAESNE